MPDKKDFILVLKSIAAIVLTTFAVLLAWIFLIYFFNARLQWNVSADEIFFYLLFSLMLVFYPIFTKILISRSLSKKIFQKNFADIPILSKSEWGLFSILHLIGAIVLFWWFANGERLQAVEDYLINVFGRNRRAGANVPPLAIYIVTSLTVQFGMYFFYAKLFYGAFFPAFTDKKIEQKYSRLNTILFSFIQATTVIIFLGLYF